MKTKLLKKISLYSFSIIFLFLLLSQSKQFVFIKYYDFPKDRIINIPNIISKDEIFKEYCYIVEENYKNITQQRSTDMFFFKYTINDDMNLFELASRCNITYDTIATLNRIENINTSLKGKTLLLPTVQGIFITKDSEKNSLEIILNEEYFSRIQDSTPIFNIDGKEFFFIENIKFSKTIRTYFLDATLRLPIDKDKFWISSDFGKRKQPFTGEFKNHNGIDLAANVGTPVYAIKEATVSECINNDPTFGNYIILSHDNGKMTSIYAHLSKIEVSINQKVKKGELIGYVGQSGMATGPHLHFEIRQGGTALDPESKIKLR